MTMRAELSARGTISRIDGPLLFLRRNVEVTLGVADHIVDTDCMRQYPNLVRIPGLIVDAVVWWPFSAWPAASPGVHDVDEAHMKAMNKALSTAEGTAEYRRDYVDSYTDSESYLDMIGRDKVAELSNTATAFLLDPFRQWILSDADVRALLAEGEAAPSLEIAP